jgi:hypothetical protein
MPNCAQAFSSSEKSFGGSTGIAMINVALAS